MFKLKYALHRGDYHYAEELQRQLDEKRIMRDPKFHISGFAHPQLLVFTNTEPMKPQEMTWGLIAPWVKSMADAKKIMKSTLNCRSETMFELNSFKYAALHRRCLIYIDAFYEYHHYNGKTYPFRIAMANGEPMAMAGLWSEWVDKSSGEIIHSVSIVTTRANALMARIHNRPKASEGARMPVILPREKQDEWLVEIQNEEDKQKILNLAQPLDENQLEAHTVARLSGKEAIGNVKEVENPVRYPELEF